MNDREMILIGNWGVILFEAGPKSLKRSAWNTFIEAPDRILVANHHFFLSFLTSEYSVDENLMNTGIHQKCIRTHTIIICRNSIKIDFIYDEYDRENSVSNRLD